MAQPFIEVAKLAADRVFQVTPGCSDGISAIGHAAEQVCDALDSDVRIRSKFFP
ncbi:hypothetical protein [Blastochloris sulfoviridis]|uniref:hypothetical protein n=1 Tax=Blastochloris sulfoviridis TaxID=50712 RepID=UPI001478194A|nr:hypothetical protein [Blastochloris sulfoviridis]